MHAYRKTIIKAQSTKAQSSMYMYLLPEFKFFKHENII